ncbi:hypothetical protein V6N12_030139 [Hibiscus sabdariffa]|uniref:Uncharacterized protein n=1 Tax=Hibiscus sabdariffa TaxID=183260 RepID=A0ABR2C098_9ROSI
MRLITEFGHASSQLRRNQHMAQPQFPRMVRWEALSEGWIKVVRASTCCSGYGYGGYYAYCASAIRGSWSYTVPNSKSL